MSLCTRVNSNMSTSIDINPDFQRLDDALPSAEALPILHMLFENAHLYACKTLLYTWKLNRFNDQCDGHSFLSEEDKDLDVEEVFACPCGNTMCNVCVEAHCELCDACEEMLCFHCTRNSWCNKCERTVCLLCTRTTYCEHCNTTVCRDCGYDFCETCMKVVCEDCGVVTWNSVQPPYSACTFCLGFE